MSKFPRAVPLPENVHLVRRQRNKQIVKSTKIGIGIRFAIILIELLGAGITASSTLLTDALASLVDVISSIFLILCIKLAQRPPDEDHPFGHGRYEPLGGLLLGALLGATGASILIQQVFGLAQEVRHQEVHAFAWAFSLIAMILLEICYQIVIYTARKERSPALVSDAIHYRIDGMTSLLATVALIVVAYVPQWGGQIDHIGAILIAICMIGVGFYASIENFHQIMDKVPDQRFFNLVRIAAEKVKGVKGTEKIRIQSYGPDAHIDIDVEVDPRLTVDLAHRISQQVRVEIQKVWPAVRDVTVHVEPYYVNDH